MKNFDELSSTDFAVLDAIRRSGSLDRAILETYSGLSWPTVKKIFSQLQESENIQSSTNEQKCKKFVRNQGYFLGISIGMREIKAVFCDSQFQVLSYSDIRALVKSIPDSRVVSLIRKSSDYQVTKERTMSADSLYFCFESSSSQDVIADIITEIIEAYLTLGDASQKLLGIGLAFPGVVEPQKEQIIACPNIPSLNGKELRGILKHGLYDKLKEYEIPIYIEHNAKANFINEKELLYSDQSENSVAFKENVLCLYMGTGISLGGCINRTLVTGSTNSFGEIGHISVSDDLAEFGKDDHDVCPFCHQKCIEWLIRKNVFDASTIRDYRENSTTKKLKSLSQEKYKKLTQYLGYLLNVIINIFNPDVLILSGRIFDNIEELRGDIESLKSSHTLSFSGSNCKIVLGKGGQYGIARGAAFNTYMRHYTFKDKRIQWPTTGDHI